VKVDRVLVGKVARLASLDLTDTEAAELSGQLTRIVEHFEALREVPESLLAEAPDAARAPLRADEARDGSPGPLVEKNAPGFSHGHFVVPRVVSRD
jgi:aspartyl-tRNA(Asn)/glutamyl-tRNA(Gln) amidotransferase subunit C